MEFTLLPREWLVTKTQNASVQTAMVGSNVTEISLKIHPSCAFRISPPGGSVKKQHDYCGCIPFQLSNQYCLMYSVFLFSLWNLYVQRKKYSWKQSVSSGNPLAIVLQMWNYYITDWWSVWNHYHMSVLSKYSDSFLFNCHIFHVINFFI